MWLAGGEAPSALLHALSQSNQAVSVVADAPAVLREVMGGGVRRVVLVDPEQLEHAGEMVTVLHTRYDDVTCFGYAGEDHADTLRGLIIADPAAMAWRWSDQADDITQLGVDDDRVEAEALPGIDDGHDPARLTDEEVAMLLGPAGDGREPHHGEEAGR